MVNLFRIDVKRRHSRQSRFTALSLAHIRTINTVNSNLVPDVRPKRELQMSQIIPQNLQPRHLLGLVLNYLWLGFDAFFHLFLELLDLIAKKYSLSPETKMMAYLVILFCFVKRQTEIKSPKWNFLRFEVITKREFLHKSRFVNVQSILLGSRWRENGAHDSHGSTQEELGSGVKGH